MEPASNFFLVFFFLVRHHERKASEWEESSERIGSFKKKEAFKEVCVTFM